jgi:hypothetical protein
MRKHPKAVRISLKTHGLLRKEAYLQHKNLAEITEEAVLLYTKHKEIERGTVIELKDRVLSL